MYEHTFGLNKPPFSITPDVNAYYRSEPHEAVITALLYAIEHHEYLLKVTGAVGSGKTLMCRLLLDKLNQKDYQTAYLFNTTLSTESLYHAISTELGIKTSRLKQHDKILGAIHKHLLNNTQQGIRTVLIVDEAHHLSPEVLEALRMLTNLENGSEKLLTLVLMGQPELDGILSTSHMRQFSQRISVSLPVKPLRFNELHTYIQHRMIAAGYKGYLHMSLPALWLLYRATRGIPRMINILCHKALMVASYQNKSKISAKQMRKAILDSHMQVNSVKLEYQSHLHRTAIHQWFIMGAVTIAAIAFAGIIDHFGWY